MVRRSAPLSSKWVAKEWRKRCGEQRLCNPARRAATTHASHRTFGRDGFVSPPAVDGAGKQPRLRPHPPVVHTQRCEQRRAEWHVPIPSSLPPLDVNQHAPAIDVLHLQMAQLRVSHAGRVEDHQHRAVRQTVGGVDHPRHLLDAEDLRQPPRGFGVRRVIEQVPPLQRFHEEEAQRRHVEANRQRLHPPLAEQIHLIGPEVRLIQPVGPTLEVSSELLDRVEIR